MTLTATIGSRPLHVCRVATVAATLRLNTGEQLKYLIAKGIRLTLIANAGPDLDETARWLGVRSIGIPMKRAPSAGHDTISLARLVRTIRREQFDIVHSLTPKAGLLTMTAASLARTPIRMHTYTGQVWATSVGWTRWLGTSVDRTISQLATDVYADGFSQRAFLERERVVAAARVKVLASGSIQGVNLDRFSPITPEARKQLRATLGIAPAEFAILFVGRITADKGIELLLDAFCLLRSRGNVSLIVVGPIERDRRRRPLSEQVLDRLKNERGVFHLAETDPLPFYQAADVLCLPSQREGFPSVVLEAAACGIPTVASDIYGIRDAVEDGRTGLLFAGRNPAELARPIGRMIDYPALREELGMRARSRTEAYFDGARVNQAVLTEYQSLWESRVRTGP